jgi:transposase
MRPTPLRLRIVDAVKLQPMTVRQIASCLCVNEWTVRRMVYQSGVQPSGIVRTKGRPWITYEVAA